MDLKKRFNLTLIIIFCLASIGFAEDRNMSEISKYKGMDMHLDDIGASVGGFYQWSLAKIQWSLYGGWLTITEPTYTDYYGYSHKINEISLDMLKAGAIFKYHIFKGMIANSFSPFLAVQGGAVLALDTPENMDFFDKFSHVETIPGMYGGLFVGIDFQMSRNSAFSIAIGTESHVLNEEVDGKSHWGGKAVVLQFGTFTF